MTTSTIGHYECFYCQEQNSVIWNDGDPVSGLIFVCNKCRRMQIAEPPALPIARPLGNGETAVKT